MILKVRKDDFLELIPSKTLMITICGNMIITFAISTFGIPGLILIATFRYCWR
jgi:hypothetical protein